jgi:hypothetical protein
VFRGHVAAINAVAVQPTGHMICSGSWDRTVRIWATGLKLMLHDDDEVTSLAPSEDDEFDQLADGAKRKKLDGEGALVKVVMFGCVRMSLIACRGLLESSREARQRSSLWCGLRCRRSSGGSLSDGCCW